MKMILQDAKISPVHLSAGLLLLRWLHDQWQPRDSMRFHQSSNDPLHRTSKQTNKHNLTIYMETQTAQKSQSNPSQQEQGSMLQINLHQNIL